MLAQDNNRIISLHFLIKYALLSGIKDYNESSSFHLEKNAHSAWQMIFKCTEWEIINLHDSQSISHW